MISSGAAMAMVLSLVVGAPAAQAVQGAGTQASSAQASSASACRVVTMPQPANAQYGTVMDIETVPGLGTVYFGSIELVEQDGGFTRHAVVWYGLDAQPVRVGPADLVDGVAFELTPSGLINGQGVDAEGREHAWVQSLRSGAISHVAVEPEADGFGARRINSRGDVVGTVWLSELEAEARVWSPRPDRPGTALPADFPYAEGWDITDDRRVAGSTALELPEFGVAVPWGAVWSARGALTHVASNPGVQGDTYVRLIDEGGATAGLAWYGDWYEGHYEAARWPTPDRLESLGLLPGGGFSGIYGQSEDGWVVGLADHVELDGEVVTDHAVLWTDASDSAIVLPSPYAIAQGDDDWRSWMSGAPHGVHRGLDQVGSMSHTGWFDDGSPRFDAVVYLNASACGERVGTTHTAVWEAEASLTDASRSMTADLARPAAYDHGALQRVLREP